MPPIYCGAPLTDPVVETDLVRVCAIFGDPRDRDLEFLSTFPDVIPDRSFCFSDVRARYVSEDRFIFEVSTLWPVCAFFTTSLFVVMSRFAV